jgi:hypothetical protein
MSLDAIVATSNVVKGPLPPPGRRRRRAPRAALENAGEVVNERVSPSVRPAKKTDRLAPLFVLLAMPLIAPVVLWYAVVAFVERLFVALRKRR